MKTAVAMSATVALLLSGFIVTPTQAATNDTITARKASPLTPTLQRFSEDPATAPQSAAAQEIATGSNGRIVVEVRLADTSDESLAALRATGATVRFVDDALRTVTITIAASDLDDLEDLAPLLLSAREVLEPMTNATCPRGTFVSEGWSLLRASLAATNFSVTGRDVTVGVISDSYNRKGGAATDVANGELPGAGGPCDNTTPVTTLEEGPVGTTDEGRAMAQIVHDMAPDAELLFATASISESGFAQNIRDLATAGADIIVDDMTWFDEPMYQDGVVAKAVADVVADGVAYFSSAANSNLILGGRNVASYEAPSFRAAACPATVVSEYTASARCHDFDPSASTDVSYDFSVSNDNVRYTLGWSEPRFGITTDLDLCLLNTSDTVLGCATANNLTTQLAFEGYFTQGKLTGDYRWAVVRPSGTGTPRMKLISHRTNLTSVEHDLSGSGDVVGPTTFGHNASRPGVTVAAVPYYGLGALEGYSSFGPATYCWGPVVGITPASALSPCQTATVDITATDGTQNSFFGGTDGFGVHRFYGTSASAPHAAGVAALMIDREQCLTPAQVTTFLASGARTVGTAPVDGAGAGLVDANAALTAAGAADCDNLAPLVKVEPPRGSGWYTSASVLLGVAATDRRTISDIDCTFATVGRTAGIGTPNASATAVTTGEGTRVVNCKATDGEGNLGARFGSTNVVTIKIDSVAPTLTCRPATFQQGQPGTVTADVADATSGPAAPTVSTAVPTATAGSFSASLTGKDVAGNSRSTSCGYAVVPPPDTAAPTLVCRPLTLSLGQTGEVVADVSDSGSGPAAATVTAGVTGSTAGTFEVSLTGSDNAGNTTTVACPYTVSAGPVPTAALTGPGTAKAGKTKKFTATGFPATATITWSLTRKGKTIWRKTTRTSTSGTSASKVRFPKKGTYSVRAVSGSVTAAKSVKVR